MLQNTDPGINSERVLIVGVPVDQAKYATLEQRNRFTEDLLNRVRTLPGVEFTTIGLPLGGPQSPYTIVGHARDDAKRIGLNPVGADHLRMFQIPLRRGRMFDAAEVARADRVAVINEAAAKAWPAGEDPIGSRVRLGMLERLPARVVADTNQAPEVTIIGVMADTRNAGLRAQPQPTLAMPYSVVGPPSRTLALRTTGDPNLLLNPVRAQVREIDPDQPLGRPITLEELQGEEFTQPRFTMALFAAFAVLGLALAAAGIYSVLSFHVTRRTHELGVPHGPWRPARPRAQPDVDDGRAARRIGSWSAWPSASRRPGC